MLSGTPVFEPETHITFESESRDFIKDFHIPLIAMLTRALLGKGILQHARASVAFHITCPPASRPYLGVVEAEQSCFLALSAAAE